MSLMEEFATKDFIIRAGIKLTKEVYLKVDETYCRLNKVFPLGFAKRGNTKILRFVCCDIDSLDVGQLRFLSGLPIELVKADESLVNDLLEKFFPEDLDVDTE